jgi:hypothetical protein
VAILARVVDAQADPQAFAQQANSVTTRLPPASSSSAWIEGLPTSHAGPLSAAPHWRLRVCRAGISYLAFKPQELDFSPELDLLP